MPGLYFELRVDGRPVDPLQWLKKTVSASVHSYVIHDPPPRALDFGAGRGVRHRRRLPEQGRRRARTPISTCKIFDDVVGLITGNYVEKVDVDKVMGGAMHGLADSLDPDSAFLSRRPGEADREQTPRCRPATSGSI